MTDLTHSLLNRMLQGLLTPREYARETFQLLGQQSLAGVFAENESAESYLGEFLRLVRQETDSNVVRGAFLVYTEWHERREQVDPAFVECLLSIWTQMTAPDELILEYVMNRFPELRERWVSVLQAENKLTTAIEERWHSNQVEFAFAVLQAKLQDPNEPQGNLEMVDSQLPHDMASPMVYDLARRVQAEIGLQAEVPKPFVDLLANALRNTSLKLSTRFLFAQLLSLPECVNAYGRTEMATLFYQASLRTLRPLGPFLFTVSKRMKIDSSTIVQTLARGSRVAARTETSQVGNVVHEIHDDVWLEIADAFQTKAGPLQEQLSEHVTPRLAAIDLLRGKGLTVPINLAALSEQLSLHVMHVDLPIELEGFTMKSRDANRGLIVLNRQIQGARARFTWAHEIGHFLMHEFAESQAILMDTSATIQNQSQRIPEWEKQANEFAQFLLLPPQSPEEHALSSLEEPFLPQLERLASEWEISLSVLVSRFVQHTNYELLVVMAKNADVRFYRYSNHWEDEREHLHGRTIPHDTSAYMLSTVDHPQLASPKQVFSDVWFEALSGQQLIEESFATGYDNCTYTLLYRSR